MDVNQLFPALMTQDNQLRTHAEGVYSSFCGSQTDDLVVTLTNCLAHHEVMQYLCLRLSFSGVYFSV